MNKVVGVDNIKVNCYSGYTHAERPESFEWRGEAHEVENIEKAWQEPGKRCFIVKTKDNKLFQLCYNEVKDHWSGVEIGKGG